MNYPMVLEMSIEDQRRIWQMESDFNIMRVEHMRLLERVSLLELASPQYEDSFDEFKLDRSDLNLYQNDFKKQKSSSVLKTISGNETSAGSVVGVGTSQLQS